MFSSKIIKIDSSTSPAIKDFIFTGLQDTHNNPDKFSAAGKSLQATPHSSGFKSFLENSADQNQTLESNPVQEDEGIVNQARRKAAAIEKEAYEKAYAQGEKAGREIGEKKLSSAIGTFENIIAELTKTRNDFYSSHQEQLFSLALTIAKAVIHQEVLTNQELVIGVVRAALKYATECENIKIRLHPADVERCIERRSEILKGFEGLKQIVFEPDENVGRGGAVVESDLGEIDARLDHQLEEVARELRLAYQNREKTLE